MIEWTLAQPAVALGASVWLLSFFIAYVIAQRERTRRRLPRIPVITLGFGIVIGLWLLSFSDVRLVIRHNDTAVRVGVMLDVSYSMTADDLSPSRFDAALQWLGKAAQRFGGVQWTVIAFDETARVVAQHQPTLENLPLLRPAVHNPKDTLLVAPLRLAQAMTDAPSIWLVLSDFADKGDETALRAALEGLQARAAVLCPILVASPRGGTVRYAFGPQTLRVHVNPNVQRAALISAIGACHAVWLSQIAAPSELHAYIDRLQPMLTSADDRQTIALSPLLWIISTLLLALLAWRGILMRRSIVG